jgi:tetratricopeptide (TPR) repeat protein
MFALAMLPVRCAARVIVCASLIAAIGSTTARAQDADALIKQGVELRREGKDQAALEQFRQAFDVAPSPRALAQMGLAEHALGRWVDAETHIRKALEAAQDPWIAKYRGTLEESRARIAEHLGTLVPSGGPDGGELRLDGQIVGTLPASRALRLPVGAVALEVVANGHVVLARTVNIAPGTVTREDLGLPAPSVAAPGASDVAAAPSSTGRRKLEWIAGGAAVGVGAVGVAFLLAARHDANDFNGNLSCRMQTLPSTCTSQRDSGNRDYAIEAAAFAVAGALAVTSAVLYFTTPERPAVPDRRVACLPALAPGQAGAACALRF